MILNFSKLFKFNSQVIIFITFACFLFCTTPSFAIDSLQLHWSTFIGGSDVFWGGYDIINQTDTDAEGNFYLVGETRTANLPNRTNSHPWDNTCGFAAKVDENGSILWTTYIGGTNYSTVNGITIDPEGENIYVTGKSDANDIPGVLNPGWGYGAYVSCLSATSGSIEWTRFLTNGSYGSQGNALRMYDGYIYVTGYSYNYQLLKVENEFTGAQDTFVSKLTTDGNVVKSVWYCGSQGAVKASDIFINGEGDIFLAGDIDWQYAGTTYDLPNAVNQWHGGNGDYYDAFACKMDSDLHVIWSLYIGGSNNDHANSIIGDNLGNLWVSGWTYSENMEGDIIEPYNFDGGDGYLTKIDENSGDIDWNSYSNQWGGCVDRPKLLPCRKIITIAKSTPSFFAIQFFDADLGTHQWFITEDCVLPLIGNHFADIYVDEDMNIYIFGDAPAANVNFPDRNNEHSGQDTDVLIVKTSPKDYFYHFNQQSATLPSNWVSSPADANAWSVNDNKLNYNPQSDFLSHAFLNENFFNLNMHVQCTKTNGTADPFGIAFKNDPQSDMTYYFNVSTNGSFYVDMFDGQSWAYPMLTGSSDFIKQGLEQCNILEVAARDSIVKFYCNGGYLGEIKTETLYLGRVGVFVINSVNTQNEVEFDNFYVGSYTYNVTDVAPKQSPKTLPTQYKLSQNYPNPFNPETTIQYSIPKKSDVTLEIFNLKGQKIKTLVSKTQQAGSYSIVWDSRTEQGTICPSGLYLYKITACEFIDVKKIMLVK